jgi:hypothetical protein
MASSMTGRCAGPSSNWSRISPPADADTAKARAAADEANRAEAFLIIRDLVDRIVVRPTGPYRPVEIEIHGTLAGLLEASASAAACSSPESRGVMVAGARNDLYRTRFYPIRRAVYSRPL